MDERKEKWIDEAVKRMQMLQLYDEPKESVIRMFQEEGKVCASYAGKGNRVGVLYALSEAEKRLVEEFERQSGYLVYHVIRNEMTCLTMMMPEPFDVQYSFLYVSDREAEWEREREDISGIETYILYPEAYVYSAGFVMRNAQDLSGGHGEIMRIGITYGYGGLCRVS
ncbi:MAG: hypothetical protein NC517_07530 [Firmicutes bacterium]|nr:hypothetical protein [Bacillota bacterium]